MGLIERWPPYCISRVCRRVVHDETEKAVREGEGSCSLFFAVRSHLPLRGKLGWMTPRVGVKTTLTMERAFSGLPVPSGSNARPRAFCTLCNKRKRNTCNCHPDHVSQCRLHE